MNNNPWLLCAQAPASRVRLYCFSYAGGNAHSFLPWQNRLPPSIQVCAVQLPGRGRRFGEKPFDQMAPLVKALAEALPTHHDVPAVYFGHSLGALLAFEVARYRTLHGLQSPRHLIVSGAAAPSARATRSRLLHALPDNEFIDALRDYNGTPAEVLENRELMELLSPTLRADFSVVENYAYRSGLRLGIPVTVFAGTGDDHVSPEQVEAWGRETARPPRVHWFDGDHFFIHSQESAVLATLKNELAYLPGEPLPWREDRSAALDDAKLAEI